MSKKRASDEPNNDEETNEEIPVHRDGNAKRGKHDLLNATTIDDLQFELLELILVKVVVMEVKDLNLAKSVWRDKADLSIDRLRTVCSQWSDILTTKSFRTKLHRTLDNTAQTIRLRILHQFSFQSSICCAAALNDEIFMLHELDDGDSFITVSNRSDMTTVKDVIPLPGPVLIYMMGCNASNCVYASLGDRDAGLSVVRISRDSDADEQFKMTPWKNEHDRPIYTMSVSTNGSLMIFSTPEGEERPVVCIYNANGSLQREVTLPLKGRAFTIQDLLLKSNGNLVVVYYCDTNFATQLLEIDTNGCAIRRFQTLYEKVDCSICVDNSDRIWIPIYTKIDTGFELLDSEFNLIGGYVLPQDESQDFVPLGLCYNNERNEIIQTYYDMDSVVNFMTIFRLTVA